MSPYVYLRPLFRPAFCDSIDRYIALIFIIRIPWNLSDRFPTSFYFADFLLVILHNLNSLFDIVSSDFDKKFWDHCFIMI